MSDDTHISRHAFDEAVARLGITGTESHMDQLFQQVQGVLAGTAALKAIPVSGTEPDLAFRSSGSPPA